MNALAPAYTAALAGINADDPVELLVYVVILLVVVVVILKVVDRI